MREITNQARVTSKYTLPDFTAKYNDVQSNLSSTAYMTDLFSKQKNLDKTQACPNQKITQYLTLTNNSDYTIFDIVVFDTITSGATVDDGTVKINDIAYPNFDARDGIYLPNDLAAGDTVIISYTLTVDDNTTAKNVTLISNITYSVNEVEGLNENSNRVSFEILNNKIQISNNCSKTAVISGDTIVFTHTISNTGDLTNMDLFFKDTISDGAEFVSGSVTIDGTADITLDPTKGFDLQPLDAKQQTTVTYQAQIQ